METCEICACLRAQRMAAIEQGDTRKLTLAENLIARHEYDHRTREMEAAYRAAQAARVEADTLATPDRRRW